MEYSSLIVTQTEEYISAVFDEEALSVLEYKVLMNLEKGSFLQAYQMRRNGRLQLLYIIPDAFHTLQSLAHSLEPKLLFHVIEAIDRICTEVENNGFLRLEHLDVNPDHIILDINSGRLQMIYLPVSGSIGTMPLNRDSILRELFKELVNHNINMKVSVQVQQLYEDLLDQRIRLWQVMEKIHMGAYNNERYFDEKDTVPVSAPVQIQTVVHNPYLILEENRMRLEIHGTDYVLGKDPNRADGVIYNHNTVSRQHCVILHENDNYYIQDLNSKNGTYVNEQYVPAGIKTALHDGDRIRLAECNMIFYEG